MKRTPAIVPPREGGLLTGWHKLQSRICESSGEESQVRLTLFPGNVRCASKCGGIPHVFISWSNVEVPTENQWSRGECLARPVRERLHPAQLRTPVSAPNFTAVRHIDAGNLDPCAPRRNQARLFAEIRIVRLDWARRSDGCGGEPEQRRVKANA